MKDLMQPTHHRTSKIKTCFILTSDFDEPPRGFRHSPDDEEEEDERIRAAFPSQASTLIARLLITEIKHRATLPSERSYMQLLSL